ncbi:DUF2971 domain-containing protein [Pandoraea sputorum]|uniref:DUF2971 domain-containing protein n=1 Tax=Pandoraea sputorum TaxID=93222 RepID=UPI002B310B19|nr:hypothetical protein THI4931_05020 [Pandoraea sputorum]
MPEMLHKYRAITPQSIATVVSDTVYFADPASFNDPLDCKPVIENDLPLDDLASVLTKLIEERLRAEFQAAARLISYSGEKTQQHIDRLGRRSAQGHVANIAETARYYSIDSPDDGVNEADSLTWELERELLKRYDRGILSLAEKFDCPLMWSHYGDQHRGMCLGYSVPEQMRDNVKRVSYGGDRSVTTSQIKLMLEGDTRARDDVDHAVLLRKANEWRYEREWRAFGSRGPAPSDLDLKEITFGLRCKPEVIFAITESLRERPRKVRFFKMAGSGRSFRLERHEVDFSEVAQLPFSNQAVREAFEELKAYAIVPSSST